MSHSSLTASRPRGRLASTPCEACSTGRSCTLSPHGNCPARPPYPGGLPGFDSTEVSNSWIATNIQQGHGPLGAMYPDVSFGMEGDTPSFLSLIPNGLNAPEHPDWGGWGGRYELYTPALENTNPEGFTGNVPVLQEPRPIWTNAVDSYRPMVYNDYGRSVRAHDKVSTGYRTTIWRWRKEFQNDFAARMDWSIKPFEEANHPPVVKLGHSDRLTVKSGEGFMMTAAGSSDIGTQMSVTTPVAPGRNSPSTTRPSATSRCRAVTTTATATASPETVTPSPVTATETARPTAESGASSTAGGSSPAGRCTLPRAREASFRAAAGGPESAQLVDSAYVPRPAVIPPVGAAPPRAGPPVSRSRW